MLKPIEISLLGDANNVVELEYLSLFALNNVNYGLMAIDTTYLGSFGTFPSTYVNIIQGSASIYHHCPYENEHVTSVSLSFRNSLHVTTKWKARLSSKG